MVCYHMRPFIWPVVLVMVLFNAACQGTTPAARLETRPLETSQPAGTYIPESFSTPQPASTPTAEAPKAPTVTITATVQDVMRSARIIMLQEPVEGFLYVALTQDTRLISRAGQNITLQDIKAGMRIQVTGRPGSQGTVIAEEVQLLP